jgi:hypothetical protein
MFLAIDRVSKFTFVAFYDKAGKMNAAAFLRDAIEAFPYDTHDPNRQWNRLRRSTEESDGAQRRLHRRPHLRPHLCRERHYPQDQTLSSLDQRSG